MNNKHTYVNWYGNINKLIALGVLLSIPIILLGYYLWWRYELVKILVYVVIGLVIIGLLSLLIRWVIKSINIKAPHRTHHHNHEPLVWELNTLKSINHERARQGLNNLQWNTKLELEARHYFHIPSKCKHVVNTIDCPHYTSPHDIRLSIWCKELADKHYKYVGINIYNDDKKSHVVLAIK
jgi:hypothetical protein